MEVMALNGLFGGAYAGRRVLVTGHTGFKGSWLAYWLHSMGATVAGLGLDPDTTPSHWLALGLGEVSDIRVDLRDQAAVRAIFERHKPEIIFHLAAQPLVRRSYHEPADTFDINVMGLLNVLEAVRSCPSVRVIVNATTDKVYEDRLGHESGYLETDALGGHDPYSSSKVCAEVVSECYRKSYFSDDDGRGHAVRLATARAGNVIGGGDWAEDRLVPDLVRANLSGNPLAIRNPAAIRPWQHVLEPLSGYLHLGQALLSQGTFEGAWNFGPGRGGELAVSVLASQLARHLPALRVSETFEKHPHEAAVLRLNCDKANRELSWRPVWSIDTTLARTGAWYRAFQEEGQVRTAMDLAAYVSDARQAALAWAP